MKKILGLIVAALVLSAATANATNTYATVYALPGNSGSQIPGVYFDTPATMSSGDSCTAIFNTQKLYGVNSQGDGTFTTSLMWAWSTSTAGDSANVSIYGGVTSSGAFTQLYAMSSGSVNITNTLKGGTPYVLKTDVANTTLIPFPVMKFTLKAAAALTGRKRVVVLFPKNVLDIP